MEKEQGKKCFVSNCNKSDVISTQIASRGTFLAFFDQNEVPNSEAVEQGTELCALHYGVWYRHTNQSHLKCKTCGRNTDHSKSRPVPEPNLIETFLASLLRRLVLKTEKEQHYCSPGCKCFKCSNLPSPSITFSSYTENSSVSEGFLS